MSEKSTSTNVVKSNEISSTSVILNNILLIISAALHTSIVAGVLYAMFVPTLNNDPSEVVLEREFKSNDAIPFGNDHRNEYGEYYGIILAIHAIIGWISFVAIIIAASPNSITSKDGKFHAIIGTISVIMLVLVICAAVPLEIMLITSRGYVQCQWTNYSFSVFVSIHFTQWFIWIMELLNYGITFLVYKNNYNQISNTTRYFLIYLSICTIIFNLWKCAMWFVIYNNPNTINCTPPWRIWMNFGVHVLELPTIKYSVDNIKQIQKLRSVQASSNKDGELDERWKRIHGKNLRILTILVIATIFANIVYKIGGDLCGMLYLSAFLISMPILYVFELYFDFIPDHVDDKKKQN